jgi:5-methylcytosine-specific restriction protein A
MELYDLLRTIEKDLENFYGIPVCARRINRNSNDIELQISETQTEPPLGIGFIITLQWRHILFELSTVNNFLPGDIIEKWHHQLVKSLPLYECFNNKLHELGCTPKLRINKQEVAIDSLPRDYWNSVELSARSRFCLVNDNLDYHYEEFSEIVSKFWGLILSVVGEHENFSPGESDVMEGEMKEGFYRRYERKKLYREACIAINGTKCQVCGKNLVDIYGPIADGFIEVHHIIPISTYANAKVIDPASDLVPVCPTCHAMLHRKNPPYTVEELRSLIKE